MQLSDSLDRCYEEVFSAHSTKSYEQADEAHEEKLNLPSVANFGREGMLLRCPSERGALKILGWASQKTPNERTKWTGQFGKRPKYVGCSASEHNSGT